MVWRPPCGARARASCRTSPRPFPCPSPAFLLPAPRPPWLTVHHGACARSRARAHVVWGARARRRCW